MSINIIADSCCDTTPALKKAIGIDHAPLKLNIPGGISYVDDETLDIKKLLADMKASKEASGSACPSPEEYAEHMRKYDESFVITLSASLSGSHNAAKIGADIIAEESPEKRVHIFDSKSASAGELRIAIFIKELIDKGEAFDDIVEKTTEFIKTMRTLFVLEDLGNLIKNGRISKAAGVVGSMLSLRPIMSDDDNGGIICLEKPRGTAAAMRRLVEIIAQQSAKYAEKSRILVLSHCNCIERAMELKRDILAKCSAIKDVIVVPTSGLSTVYANNGGIVLAF